MSALFVGYRRQDTADASGRIYDALVAAFGPKNVFKDVYSIPAGVDFGEHIKAVLQKCRVFIALIGPDWADVRDEDGKRRLDDPTDWVRVEIETALSIPNLQVVPVLVNGATLPDVADLPESLRPLVRRNAAIIRRDPDFHDDVARLVRAIEQGAAGSMWRKLRGRRKGVTAWHWVGLATATSIGLFLLFAPMSMVRDVARDALEGVGLAEKRIVVVTEDMLSAEVERAAAQNAWMNSLKAVTSDAKSGTASSAVALTPPAIVHDVVGSEYRMLLTSKIVGAGKFAVVDEAQVRTALQSRFLLAGEDLALSDLRYVGKELNAKFVLASTLQDLSVSRRYLFVDGAPHLQLQTDPSASYRVTEVRSGRVIASGVVRLAAPATAIVRVPLAGSEADSLAQVNFSDDVKGAMRELGETVNEGLAAGVAARIEEVK